MAQGLTLVFKAPSLSPSRPLSLALSCFSGSLNASGRENDQSVVVPRLLCPKSFYPEDERVFFLTDMGRPRIPMDSGGADR